MFSFGVFRRFRFPFGTRTAILEGGSSRREFGRLFDWHGDRWGYLQVGRKGNRGWNHLWRAF